MGRIKRFLKLVSLTRRAAAVLERLVPAMALLGIKNTKAGLVCAALQLLAAKYGVRTDDIRDKR